MAKSLLDTFRSLDQGVKDTLADLGSPLLLSFAALDIAHDKCGFQKLSAEHITACLEAAGVAVTRKSVSRALARARGRVSTARNEDGETIYQLMTKGKREIAGLLGSGQMSVVRIDGGQPRTARSKLAEVLSDLKGLVRICDPYYGVRTLDSLDHVPGSCRVRFLSGKTNEAGRKLTGAIRDFKKERPEVEFRIVAKKAPIHDRYVVTSEQLLILGHGLKDIGGAESFMILLSEKLVPDLIKDTIAAFDAHWTKSTPI